MSWACAQWRGEIGAYIVGVLDGAGRDAVRAHLEVCGCCRAEYEDLVPVRGWLGRLTPADGVPAGARPGGAPPGPIRPRRRPARRRLLAAAAGAAAAGAAAAGIAVGVRADGPPAPAIAAVDHATGVHGSARLRVTATGTQIELTVTGLPADRPCTLLAVSPAHTDVAGTWNATYDGTAQITGTTAIPADRLTALLIESGAHRVLLIIRV